MFKKNKKQTENVKEKKVRTVKVNDTKLRLIKRLLYYSKIV